MADVTGGAGGSDPDGALAEAYGDLSAFAVGLDEQRSWAPTRCAGWTARDLLFHLLTDAQRLLVALLTPADGPPDVDAVSYWSSSPGAPDPASTGIRSLRAMASLWSLPRLVETFAETTAAVGGLASRTPPNLVVTTQGHALTALDLVRTGVTEAAIHHLDLRSVPAPGQLALTVARETVDGLLGRATPPEWSAAGWVLTATGRNDPTAEQRTWLGADQERLPLLR